MSPLRSLDEAADDALEPATAGGGTCAAGIGSGSGVEAWVRPAAATDEPGASAVLTASATPSSPATSSASTSSTTHRLGSGFLNNCYTLPAS